MRLTDRIEPGVKVLFVGINPGVRSALTGHHFAGYSNRFWKLLWDARLVPQPITWIDDRRLPEWGFGITNLIARPSPGIDDLRPSEYVDGWTVLESKIDHFRPEVVAFVGVTLFRAILPLVDGAGAEARSAKHARPRAARGTRARVKTAAAAIGPQPITIHGARVFVLPNPSGRNANFSYAEMLAAFRALRRALARSPNGKRRR
ncbi:MAG TPA: mismatch-specific DNA-glycosylase [Vicinamibacterales bacterium]|nr:mismatch-specific DNA-glycosylase [Vicinamibacterales bacterium]